MHRRIIQLARSGKQLFVRLRLHRLIEPVNPLLMRVSFLSKQAQWCSAHPSPFREPDPAHIRHEKRYDLYQYLLEKEHLDGEIDYLEFGVGQGNSFKWWAAHNPHPASRFVGFDTFTGLPETYGVYKPGTFSTGGAFPDVGGDPRCRFEAGLFQDTLPRFLEPYTPGRRKLVHLDADLYSSTLFVLTRLAPYLRPGDVLLFDEFGVPTHEFRAFDDFVSSYRVGYELLGAVNNYLQVAIKLV
jgi:O-methyltransferase